MFCSNCGSQIQEGEKFCSNCGTPVVGPEVQGTADLINLSCLFGLTEVFSYSFFYQSWHAEYMDLSFCTCWSRMLIQPVKETARRLRDFFCICFCLSAPAEYISLSGFTSLATDFPTTAEDMAFQYQKMVQRCFCGWSLDIFFAVSVPSLPWTLSSIRPTMYVWATTGQTEWPEEFVH